MWRLNASILLSPIIFYFIGSMVGAQSFLKKHKNYHSFTFHRYQSSVKLSTALIGAVWMPIFLYTVFYFCAFIVGMTFVSNSIIEPMFPISTFELLAFFVLRILVLLFLVQFLFIVFTKKEAAIAVILNAVVVMLILLITIHVQLVNLAVFDDLSQQFQSILIWILVNTITWLIIKFGIKYEILE